MTTFPPMLPVSLPRFAATAPGAAPQSAAPQSSSNWGGGDGNDLDFDLLAEYLLDDNAEVPDDVEMPRFDFSAVAAAAGGSGVISPEVSDDGYAPASAPKHGAAPQQPVLAPAPLAYPQQGTPMTGVPAVSTFPTLPAQIPGVVMQSNDAGTKRRVVETGMPAQVMTGVFPGVATGRGRKSVAQIERRRERNRILARRTRLRKKFFFESLQKDVTDLQRENSILKELVKQKLPPDVSQQLLADCDAMEQLPPAVQEVVGENLTDMDSQDFNLVRSIQRSQQCFVITDPSLQDNPIVYASDDFLTLTGYKREDVLGRNCRFLQGTETSPQKVEQVRKAVAMGEDVAVTMINYTADGTAFWNKLFIAALRDAQNNIVNFIGVIVKVAAPDPDDPEAGKRLPGEHAGGDDDEDDDDDDDNMADY